MKRNKMILFTAILAALLSLGLAACGNNGGESGGGENNSQSSKSAQQEKIVVTAAEGKTKLVLGESVQLTASVEGVTWSSSDDKVATVSATGLVESKGAGSATIKAVKDGYKDGSISIKVELEKIVISAAGNQKEVVVGATLQLTASQPGVTWSSSDDTVATVSASGLVTAVKFGDVTILAEKEGFSKGSYAVSVVRPAATAVLHMEDAEHYAADGEWTTSGRGPITTPVYNKDNASDGTCLAYFGAGDKETLRFTSSKAVKAEIVLMIGFYYSLDDLTQIYDVKFNNQAVAFEAQSYESEGTSDYTYKGISFGNLDLLADTNVLEITMKENENNYFPYMDDLEIYAAEPVTITLVAPATKPDINLTSLAEVELIEGETSQIVCDVNDVTYSSSKESVATVSETGLITAVAKGSATILVRKDGYNDARVSVTVSEKLAEGEIRVEAEAGTYDSAQIVFRTTSSGETCTSTWAEGAVLSVKVNATTAGQYTLTLNGRAGGQYGTSNIDDLSQVVTVKFNNSAVDVSGIAITGRTYTDYVLGEVSVVAGENTIEITALGANTAPNIDFFKLVPKA